MKQLITITQQGDNQAVNARELHQFLEVGKDFSNWIKDRIEKYGFTENEDFILLANSGDQNSHGGHNRKDYAISLDMAKELSMVERNEKGRQARRYFIAMEKEARNPTRKSLSIAQKRRLQRTELVESIKDNLLRGDVTAVARANGFSLEATQNVMRGKTFRPKIVKALFDKAMQRKQELNGEVQEMINQLNNF